jgi:EAL domain-containing protein (putative c-di-GMP-specific phosphodiesterase class I)
VEALVRWRHAQQGLVEPEQFLGLAEETGLISQVDEFVQRRAFEDVARWHAQGHPELKVAVNVSGVQVEQDNFVPRFVAAVEGAGLNCAAVTVEITEATLLRDIESIVPRLKTLRRLGVGIAIDDFGTGYSSLSYLHQFPISSLKVDRSFVGDIRADDSGAPVVDAIVAMAGSLNLAILAEGVENRSQLRYLHRHGCREVQGFLFSQPVAAGAMGVLLADDPYRELADDLWDRLPGRDPRVVTADPLSG